MAKNKKITQSARGEDCTINYVNCNYNPETTVFAHLNESFAGKGLGLKADDLAGVYACSQCHDDYDNNRMVDKYFYLLRAYYQTVKSLKYKGLLK